MDSANLQEQVIKVKLNQLSKHLAQSYQIIK